jgi:hypothetical protein
MRAAPKIEHALRNYSYWLFIDPSMPPELLQTASPQRNTRPFDYSRYLIWQRKQIALIPGTVETFGFASLTTNQRDAHLK